MTEQQEAANAETKGSVEDAEPTNKFPFLFRLRYAAYKRFPRFFRDPHMSERLDVWRKHDPAENAKTAPPVDEYIDLLCVWAVEFYTPGHMDALLEGFRKLGWDKSDGTGLSNDPVSWLQSLRRSSFGGAWFNLGPIYPSGSNTFFHPHCRTAPLPRHTKYASGNFFSLTPSLNCIVMGFVLDEALSGRFDKALRAERKTYLRPLSRGHEIVRPTNQKVDHIHEIRAESSNLAKTWFYENLPGLFSSGVPGGQMPTCEFVTSRCAEPFPLRQEGESRPPAYLTVLDMDISFDAWKSVDIPGLKFAVSGRRSVDSNQPSILSIKESDFDDDRLASWGGPGRSAQISYVDQNIGSLLSRWAILALLEEYGQHLGAVHESVSSGASTRRGPVNVLEALTRHVSHNMDIAAVTADLIQYTKDEAAFGYDIASFEPCDGRFYKDGFNLTKALRLTIGERATWLVKTDRTLRDRLAQYGSLLAAKENTRLQNSLRWMTWAILLLTLLTVAESDSVSRAFRWLHGIWESLHR